MNPICNVVDVGFHNALSGPRIAFGDAPLRPVFHQKIDKGSEP